MLYKEPLYPEKVRNYNLVIGYYKGKAIVKNESGSLFFIEGDECNFPEGTFADNELLCPLKLLSVKEQREIMSIYLGVE